MSESYRASDGRRVRACNGHSVQGIAATSDIKLPATQDLSIHGTAIEAAKSILTDGFRLMPNRNEIHFVDATSSDRQQAYMGNTSPRQLRIMVGVVLARDLG